MRCHVEALSVPLARFGDTISCEAPYIGFRKRGLLEKGSFQKSPFSRDFREFRDSRVFREPPDCGKQGDSDRFLEIVENLEILEISTVKRPFVMTPLFPFPTIVR